MTSYPAKTLQNVVLASHNAGKVLELAELFAPLGWTLQGMAELGLPAPEETGTTFRANAELKAKAAMEATGLWSLADDSGLEVAALGGLPGVQTAYYGGWEKLIDAMKDLPEKARQARFVCVLALARPGQEALFFEGTCMGWIAPKGVGNGGFGYDPVFIPEGDQRTFASMSKAEKYAFSHRGRAIEALMTWARDGNGI